MSEAEVSRIGAIIKVLKDTSHYHSSKFSDDDVALVAKLLTAWEVGILFPGKNVVLGQIVLYVFLVFILHLL